MGLVAIALLLLAFAALAAFARGEQRLAALFTAMDEVVFVFDRDGHYLEVAPNPQLVMPTARYLGRKVHEVIPVATADVVLANVRRAIASGEKHTVDYALTLDGKTSWWSAAVTPLGNDRVLWVARDITQRKRVEDALQESNVELEEELRRSEKLHRGIVEQARDVIFTLDVEGRFTSLNPVFESITGWSAAEWIGRHFREVLDPRVRQRGVEAFARAFDGDSVLLSRGLVRARDGRQVTFEVSLVTQRADGRVTGFLGLARDVTAREHEQEQLRRSEQQLKDSQRIAKLGSWEHDLVHDRIWFSDELYRLLDREPREASFTREEARRLLSAQQREQYLLATKKLQVFDECESEVCHRNAKGEESIFSCRARVDRDEHGRAVRIVGSVLDITVHRRNEQRIRESEERFRLMSRATNDIMWDSNVAAGDVWISDNLRDVLGHEPSAWTTEMWQSLVHPDDAERVQAWIASALHSMEPSWSGEYRIRKADGSYAIVLDRAYVVRDAAGHPVRVVGAMMNVTERRQMQEQLAQANQLSALGRIAAQIAHEFNNVLMGMQVNVQLLQRRAPVQLARPVENLLHSVQRGKRVTHEILSFTRGTPPELQPVPLDDFFPSWEREIRPVLGPSIDLSIAIEGGLRALADPMQIAQVLTNLALNARDAMKGRGFVEVKVERSRSKFGFITPEAADRYVHIAVADSGSGMSAEELERVFEPLFTTKHGGTGLGLAVTYQIVNKHNGFITAESEPGSGATFHVLLPLATAAEEPVEEPMQKPMRQAARILIVEDERAVAAGLEALLELDGIASSTVVTGGEAVGAIERESPDAVILDIGLPDMDGVEVYRRIAARWPHLPVLFSSGHANAAELDTLLRKPHVGLLLKPYDYDALRTALAKLAIGGIADAAENSAASLPVM